MFPEDTSREGAARRCLNSWPAALRLISLSVNTSTRHQQQTTKTQTITNCIRAETRQQ